MKRIIAIAIAVVAMATFAGSGGAALAFEPPADPHNNFDCDGGPVAGHPGANGLGTAMGHASSLTAWSAADNSDQIALCQAP